MTRLPRISEQHAQALAARTSTYASESRASFSYTQDRVTNRPVTKRALLRWAQREARFDGPVRLHSRGTSEAGTPEMSGEAKQYLGMTGDALTDWVDVACRRDEDGDYIAPIRAAIAKIGVKRPITAVILRGLVTEFCDEAEVVAPFCHPELAEDLVFSALTRLYDTYTVTPRATRPRNTVESAA